MTVQTLLEILKGLSASGAELGSSSQVQILDSDTGEWIDIKGLEFDAHERTLKLHCADSITILGD